MAIKGSVDPKLQKIKTALENIVARKHYTKTEIDSKLESKIDKTNLKTITSYKDIDTVDYTVTYDDGSTETITGLIVMDYIKAVFKNRAQASNLSGSNMRVDYGDGTTENIEATSFNHSYSDDKSYTAKIYGVTSIGRSGFSGSRGLVSIKIPPSVTSLGNGCFAGNDDLVSVIIPSSVTSLEENCFAACTSLVSVIIPSSVTSLGNSCFGGCNSLTSVIIPSSVTSLGNSCFGGCNSLTSVIIPPSVTSLGNTCFGGCNSLTSVSIPSSVTSLGTYCFEDCNSLTSIVIPSSVTSLGNYCFEGCNSLVDYYLHWDSVSSIIEYDTDIMSTNDETIFHIPSGTTQLYIDKGYPSDILHDEEED